MISISRLDRGLVQKAKWSEIFRRSRIQAVPTISNNLCPSVSLYGTVHSNALLRYSSMCMTVLPCFVSQCSWLHCRWCNTNECQNTNTQIQKCRDECIHSCRRTEEFFFKYCRKHIDLKKVRLEKDKSEISFSFILFQFYSQSQSEKAGSRDPGSHYFFRAKLGKY